MLTGFGCRTVINILHQTSVLQHGLAIVEAHNSVWGIRTADFCLTVDTAPGEQQDRSGYDYTFHGSLCVTGNTPL
jgi:hypothetical protein